MEKMQIIESTWKESKKQEKKTNKHLMRNFKQQKDQAAQTVDAKETAGGRLKITRTKNTEIS